MQRAAANDRPDRCSNQEMKWTAGWIARFLAIVATESVSPLKWEKHNAVNNAETH